MCFSSLHISYFHFHLPNFQTLESLVANADDSETSVAVSQLIGTPTHYRDQQHHHTGMVCNHINIAMMKHR